MPIFDSHCHLQFPHYDKDREETIKRALNEGVFMICVGTNYQTSLKAIELAQKYDKVYAAVGLHPNEKISDIESYKKLIEKKKVIAVGEVGLDYYRTAELERQKDQKKIFEQFLDLAIEYCKPVIIHSRDAAKESSEKVHKDILSILNSKRSMSNANLRGVIHSFTGTKEEAKKYLHLGFYLGFNGIVTFADQYDETVKYAPLEKILLETDAPYLTPVPYRGKRNEPLYVKCMAEKIARLKNVGYNRVAEQTFLNTKELFGIQTNA